MPETRLPVSAGPTSKPLPHQGLGGSHQLKFYKIFILAAAWRKAGGGMA